MATVLIVEDDPSLRAMLAAVVEADGHAVVASENGRAALGALAEQRFDLVVTDIVMPDIEGIEIIRTLSKLYPGTKIVAMSVVPGYVEMAGRLGADEVMTKPLSVAKFRAVIERLVGAPAKT